MAYTYNLPFHFNSFRQSGQVLFLTCHFSKHFWWKKWRQAKLKTGDSTSIFFNFFQSTPDKWHNNSHAGRSSRIAPASFLSGARLGRDGCWVLRGRSGVGIYVHPIGLPVGHLHPTYYTLPPILFHQTHQPIPLRLIVRLLFRWEMEGWLQVNGSWGGELGLFGRTVRSRSVESIDVSESWVDYDLERGAERWLIGILL